jgi:hypothetical protein
LSWWNPPCFARLPAACSWFSESVIWKDLEEFSKEVVGIHVLLTHSGWWKEANRSNITRLLARADEGSRKERADAEPPDFT